jgi:hypothetical protein
MVPMETAKDRSDALPIASQRKCLVVAGLAHSGHGMR